MSGINKLFGEELVSVNLGVEVFFDAMKQQGVKCAQVEWKPPAGGNLELIRVLEWIEG